MLLAAVGNALLARALVKTYGDGPGASPALRGVDLDVGSGEIFSIIGRNGAGKTTFLRIAATQLLPTSGTVEVKGHDVVAEANAVRDVVAVIPQEARPVFYMTPWEHVYYSLMWRGIPRGEARRRTDAILERLSLTPRRDTLVRKLSGGLRRRVLVAMVLATEAPVLFLDEPTTGLDPLARREVWEAIREASGEDRTILLTTHYLEEAEILSDRIAILEDGQVMGQGTLDDLVARVRYRFRVSLPQGGLAREALEAYGTVLMVGERALVFTGRAEAEELTRKALDKGVRAVAGPVTLEDVFVQLAGTEAEA